ncbi:cytochrome P450 [Basidiobolus meristosporus CBS 931.73]|uniref:Cytochrome P450 n=1 Tax=Basidiobolus meristosporus CBS 931.73 TaxID=1314790 RepID=A0A1Y1YSB4_9FUNG|nr:cytochrome P450 [Basidiobolus meristosporus CBS 931.73]|eukprot:ORY00912.1 cytochrome P450 [Basidiobolus meristosporus CBS 931.73]
MEIEIAVALVATFLTAYCIYVLKCYLGLRAVGNRIPGPKCRLLTDNRSIINAAGSYASFLLDLHTKYGPIARYWDGRDLVVSIDDPKFLSEIKALRLDKRVEGLNFLKGLLGASGITFLKGEKARERRRLLHSVFSRQPFEELMPKFEEIVNRAILDWEKQCHTGNDTFEVVLEPYIHKLWMSMNEYNVFGEALGHQALGQKIEATLIFLRDLRYTRILPFSSTWKQRRDLLKEVHHEVDELISKELRQREHGEERKEKAGDVMSLFLSTTDNNGRPAFSKEEIHDEVLTFLFGAFDNYVVISNTLWHLAKSPKCQQLAREEVIKICGPLTPPQKASHVLQLSYVRASIKESLRCTPVGVATWRVTDQDQVIVDHFIPKDTTIVVPMMAIHKNPKYWPNPEKYEPKRFLENGEQVNEKNDTPPDAQSLAFVPFGFGVRGCLGQRYALNAAAMVIAIILQRYEIEVSAQCQEMEWVERNLGGFSKNGTKLIFKKRSSEA